MSSVTTAAKHEHDRLAAGAVPAIEANGLRKVFGDAVAVADLTFSVAQGEVFGFLGPNGSGKSTTVKLLTGLIRATNGDARLLGKRIGDREVKRHIGYLPELFRFHDWLTASEFLDVHGRLAGMSRAARRQRIPEALELVGLAGRGDERLRTFSKGMQQRAGLAQALLHGPRLIFLDEPTSALDPIGRRIVRDVIRELSAAGTTVFLNSHLLSEVELVCDRVAILNRGVVVAAGRLDELRPGGYSVTLRIDGWTSERQTLLAQLGSIDSREDVSAGLTVLALTLASEDAIADLIAKLIAGGVRVFEVSPRSETLEDLFVRLVDQSDGMDLTTT